MSNKGISLAINQIVILIIGLVIFGLGLTLLFQVFGTAKAQLPSVDGQIEEQLRSTLSRGDVVEMPLNNKKGKAGDLITFSYGVKNDPRITQGNANFTAYTSFNTGINRAGGEFCESGSTAIANRECREKMNTQVLLLHPEWVADSGVRFFQRQFMNVSENDIIVDNIGFIANNHDDFQGIGQYFYNLCVCIGEMCETGPSTSITACNATEWAKVDNPYKFLTYSATVQ